MSLSVDELVSILETGETPVVLFGPDINNSLAEVHPDPGMKAKLLSINKADEKLYTPYDNRSFIEITVDVSGYEAHNRQHALLDYADKDGDYRLSWFDSGRYPADGICRWVEEIKNGVVTQFALDEPPASLYIVYKLGYPEDYVLLYAPNDDRSIMEAYCKETQSNFHDLEQFLRQHQVSCIQRIGGRKIVRILFEDESKSSK